MVAFHAKNRKVPLDVYHLSPSEGRIGLWMPQVYFWTTHAATFILHLQQPSRYSPDAYVIFSRWLEGKGIVHSPSHLALLHKVELECRKRAVGHGAIQAPLQCSEYSSLFGRSHWVFGPFWASRDRARCARHTTQEGGGADAAGARAHTHVKGTRRLPEGQPDRARGTHRPRGMAYQ